MDAAPDRAWEAVRVVPQALAWVPKARASGRAQGCSTPAVGVPPSGGFRWAVLTGPSAPPEGGTPTATLKQKAP